MSSTPVSGLEINKFSYWLAPVAILLTVKLGRGKEGRDLVARGETRNERFKSENEDLRDMLYSRLINAGGSLYMLFRNPEGKID